MTSFTMPLAERLDCHPVHQATAILHRAMLSSAVISPDPAEIWDDHTLRFSPAPTGLGDSPASVTYTATLSALLGLPATKDRDISCQPPVALQPYVSAAAAPLEEISGEDETLDGTTEAQLQTLVQAFHQRQRQASLIVACSIVAAIVLTFGGLALLFNLTGPKTAARQDASVEISMARTAPPAGIKPAILEHVSMAAPLLIRATPGRPLALAPLLPLGPARYLLLQGLPVEAELSAGRRTGPSTWMVKGEDASSLTLTLGRGASGDYPLDIYQLDTGDGPQARHRLILRVDPAPQQAQAGGAAISVSNVSLLHERAQRLLGEGDIAAARHLLTRAAEQGHGGAAYELALTYDREVLAKAGVHGMDSDAGIARAWYEYAAQEGHAEAGQRLQTLAKRRAAS